MPNAYDAQRQAANTMAWYILAAVPTGILGRLGVELVRGAYKPPKDTGITSEGYRLPIDMPIERSKKNKKQAMEKEAENIVSTIHKKLSDAIYNTFANGPMGSNSATSPWNVPFMAGVGVPAAFLTGIGAWGGTGKLLTDAKRTEKKTERDAAKEEYNRLLQLALQTARQSKTGSALDSLAELRGMNKSARSPWEVFKDYGGGATGVLTALSILTALGSGKYMWDKTKSRTKNDLVAEARRIRAMRDIHGPGTAMYIPQIDEVRDEEEQLV